jgi:hypothetical protein
MNIALLMSIANLAYAETGGDEIVVIGSDETTIEALEFPKFDADGNLSASGVDVETAIRDWFWKYYSSANSDSFGVGDPPNFNTDPIREISDWLGNVEAPLSEVIALSDDSTLGTGNILVFGTIITTCTCPSNGPVCNGAACEYFAGGGGGGGIFGHLGISCSGMCATDSDDVGTETPPPEEFETPDPDPDDSPESDDPQNASVIDTCETIACANTRYGIDDPDYTEGINKAYCQRRIVPTLICP